MLKIAEVLDLVRFDLMIVGEERRILTHFAKYNRCSTFPGRLQCQLLPHGCIALCPTFYPLMCKKIAPTPSSVWCSPYLLNIIAVSAHRKSPQQAVESRRNPMAPLLHPFSSLAFRWPCIRPTTRTSAPHHRRIILARILMGSRMESRMS
jgi:hypothetical protein